VHKERRRRGRYQAAHWTARYRWGGASGWRECELVDVSEDGAGFQAFMLGTDANHQADVELELVDRADPERDPLRLAGRVRHIARSEAGHIRVGMQFEGLTDLEVKLLALVFRRDTSRRPSATV
jgi:hypothetical protein